MHLILLAVILEGSIELRKDFLEFVRTRYPLGEEMVKLGGCGWVCVCACVCMYTMSI